MTQFIHEINGTIEHIADVREYEGQCQTYRSIDIAIDIAGKYKNTPCITFGEFLFKKIEALNPGDRVWCRFEVSGKQYTNRDGETSYFNTLRGQGIGLIKSGQPSAIKPESEELFDSHPSRNTPANTAPSLPAEDSPLAAELNNPAGDDLPF
jgi:hypothetical protein